MKWAALIVWVITALRGALYKTLHDARQKLRRATETADV
jgi:hypothetical protein